jgi:hypothetical protein
MYKLTPNPNIILRLMDKTKIPFDELNPDYLQYKDWLEQGNTPLESDEVLAQTINPKLVGIEFEGIMCSATKEDQSGLLAVYMAYQIQGDSFEPTVYEFENKNTLILTKNNIQDFIDIWMPFRQSFFLSGN